MSEDFAATNQEAPEVEATEVATAETEAPEVELDEQGNPVEPAPEEDAELDTEEVEHDGKKYRLPKDLKPLLMMNADYTRKTQELAEQRRQVEERGTALQRQAQEHEQNLREVARIVAIDEQLESLANVDWQEWVRADPIAAQSAFMRVQQMRDQRGQIVGTLNQRQAEAQAKAQQSRAEALNAAGAKIKAAIPGWSPAMRETLTAFAKAELGYDDRELNSITDPRQVITIHKAYQATQLLNTKQAAVKAEAKAAAPQAKPVPQVGGGNAPAVKDPERMPVDQWMKHRDEQLRKRNRR